MEMKNIFRFVYGLVLLSLIYLMATGCNKEKESEIEVTKSRVKMLEQRIEALENDMIEKDVLIYELSENNSLDDTSYNSETYFYE